MRKPALPGRDALDRVLAAIPPASGAVVMGTGIVSIGLGLDHRKTLSVIVFVVAAAAWVTLGLLLGARTLRDRGRVRREALSPAALTGVAATAVLGARVSGLGWDQGAIALLVIATLMWLVLIAPVLRSWATPTVGVAFMTAVSTESLAVLGAALAIGQRAQWLLYAALVPFVVGLLLYLFVLRSFDFRQLVEGRGDHWITGGALAISTLAAARITLAARALHELSALSGELKTISLVLWAVTIAWLPVLLAAEAMRPRPAYDVRRWATVFPVGMYAACSFDAGAVAQVSGITDFARVWVWVGLAVWLVVLAGMLRRVGHLEQGEHPAASAERVEEVAPAARRPPS